MSNNITLGQLIAKGAAFRHREHTTEQVRALVQMLLSGGGNPLLGEPEVTWVREAGAGLAQVVDKLLIRAENLHEELLVAQESPDPDDEAWVWWITRVLHEREEIEGARLLLKLADRKPVALDAVLALLDSDGYVAVRALPIPSSLADDVILQRVARRDHTAWWAHPAAAAYGEEVNIDATGS